MSKGYRLKVRLADPACSFEYRLDLYRPDGTKVDFGFSDTIWGAKRWARRTARKDQRKHCTYEFEVRP